MTDHPQSDHGDAPRPELSAFLHDRAGSLDREAPRVTADEASERTVVAASAPKRRLRSAFTPSSARTSPRSALAAAAVIALVVGAVGGFAYGRSSAPKHSTVQTATAAKPEAGDTSSPPSTAVTNKFGAVSAGGASVAAIGNGKMTRVFDRTTTEGVAIHVFTSQTDPSAPVPSVGNCAPNTTCTEVLTPSGASGAPACGQVNWCPPPECYSSGITIEASNGGAVTQTGAPSYPLDDVAAIMGTVMLGHAEGSPAIGWAVRTKDPAALVTATWSDGFTDQMVPQGGWAVVMHNGTVSDATIEVLDVRGNTLKTSTVDPSTYAQTPAQCTPPPPAPPALPPAGAEQPDDPAAAKDAITNAYQTVFTHGSDATLNQSLMEDPASLQDALNTTKSNFPQAVDTVTVNVGDIVFTSKTEAALYFELNYTGGAQFGKQIGYAKLIDGTWKISHDTMCMVLSWGGGQCGSSSSSSGSSGATGSGVSGSGVVVPPGAPVTTVQNN
jgi:hypothetical protein